jgi:ESS family glutamate:Na+ symporter
MIEIDLDLLQSAALGAVMMIIGMLAVRRFAILRKFCIPAAVVGGLLFSLFTLIMWEGGIAIFTIDDTLQKVCMNMFFCSVGFLASFSTLKSGGRVLGILIVLVTVMIIMQDIIGPTCASLFGMDPKFGLTLGSISLFGGHGTAAAYGDILVEEYGMKGADVVALASATFGLAIAGILGGPLARRLVVRNNLVSDGVDDRPETKVKTMIDPKSFVLGMAALIICIGVGSFFNDALEAIGFVLPSYFGALIVAVIFRNFCDAIKFRLPIVEIDTIGWVCLSLFLSMALMSIELWQLHGLGAFMFLTLIIQTIVLCLFVYFVVFRATGKNYESAALSAGFMGFGMGATPNAVANVEALTEAHGPAPMAFFLVPIVGGVFVDIVNAAVLTILLNTL